MRLRYPRIKGYEYFYVGEWKESECVGTLTKELGWQTPPGAWTTWRADCDFGELKDYMFEKMKGVSYYEAMLSNLIRAGQISRDEAMRRLAAKPFISWVRMQRVLDVLDLPVDFIDETPEPAGGGSPD